MIVNLYAKQIVIVITDFLIDFLTSKNNKHFSQSTMPKKKYVFLSWSASNISSPAVYVHFIYKGM